jgi:hypothetical protein
MHPAAEQAVTPSAPSCTDEFGGHGFPQTIALNHRDNLLNPSHQDWFLQAAACTALKRLHPSTASHISSVVTHHESRLRPRPPKPVAGLQAEPVTAGLVAGRAWVRQCFLILMGHCGNLLCQ